MNENILNRIVHFVQHVMFKYPSITPNPFNCIDHLFLVNGNGYDMHTYGEPAETLDWCDVRIVSLYENILSFETMIDYYDRKLEYRIEEKYKLLKNYPRSNKETDDDIWKKVSRQIREEFDNVKEISTEDFTVDSFVSQLRENSKALKKHFGKYFPEEKLTPYVHHSSLLTEPSRYVPVFQLDVEKYPEWAYVAKNLLQAWLIFLEEDNQKETNGYKNVKFILDYKFGE